MFNLLFGRSRIKIGRKLADLEARLSGVNGFTGRGEIEYSAWHDGSRELEVELRGVAGRAADVIVNDVKVISVALDNGRVDATFDTRLGDAIPDLGVGGRVEIRQNGEAILKGVLAQD